jgi:hypothetical protein
MLPEDYVCDLCGSDDVDYFKAPDWTEPLRLCEPCAWHEYKCWEARDSGNSCSEDLVSRAPAMQRSKPGEGA